MLVGLTDDVGERLSDHVYRATRRLSSSEVDPLTRERTRYEQYIYFIWCAFNESNSVTFRNPNNYPAGADPEDLPAPINFIEDELNHDDPAARATYLRFFAAADQPARAQLWQSLFDGEGEAARPRQRVTATASATVFNTHSWDLWTQMWHAQLAPVGDLDGWLDDMQRTGAVTEDIPDLEADEVGETFRYLRAVVPFLEIVGRPGEVRE